MDYKTISVALTGCGRIAAKHIEALANLYPRFKTVALCDVELGHAEAKSKLYMTYLKEKGHEGVEAPIIYQSHEEMVGKCAFELGVVATESGNHYSHVMTLLDSNKHVLVEKPIALSTADADKMIETAKAKGLILSVSHQNRFNPPVQALKKAIDEKRFGKLINGTARILWTRDQSYYQQAQWRGTAAMDGGTLMNQCIHNIDLLLWMMDSPVQSVYAQTGTFMRNIEMEDFGTIMIRFESGAIGLVEGSACVYPKNLEETLSIFGEMGTVVIGGLAVNEIEQWLFSEMKLSDQDIQSLNDKIDSVYGNGHGKLYENIYSALRENETLVIDGDSGSQAMRVILAAYKSQAEGMAIDLKDFNYSTLDFLKGK